MFETLGVEGLCLMDASVLALGVANLTTGVVLDIGMDGHVAVPIVHGSMSSNSLHRNVRECSFNVSYVSTWNRLGHRPAWGLTENHFKDG